MTEAESEARWIAEQAIVIMAAGLRDRGQPMTGGHAVEMARSMLIAARAEVEQPGRIARQREAKR